MYKNLRHFITTLEQAGELVRIKEYVNPHLESTEIVDRLSKNGGPAVLFENTGYDFPLLMNSMGTNKRMSMALEVENLDDIAKDMEELLHYLSQPKEGWLEKIKTLPRLGKVAGWMPKHNHKKGECQQVVMTKPDITKLPVQKCWPEDGGPFLTLPIIHTKDPETGTRNVGLYRMQVFAPDLTAMHWHRHKVSAKHFQVYKKLKQRMPVAVALGGDPVYTYCATAPLPENIDEYMLAGFLRKKPVELVKCMTQDVWVPHDCDFIIEGYIDPEEELILEGPFGDHTGYYSLEDYYPRFHITAITHRKDAVYPGTIVGIPPQEDAWIGKATERIFLVPIKMMLIPEIIDMVLPVEGVFHNLAIIKIEKTYPGQAIKVMNSLWGAGQMMFTKIIIVVDGSVNIHDPIEVAKVISSNFNPATDIVFSQGPVDVLDHSCSKMAFGGKLGMDATRKLPEENQIIFWSEIWDVEKVKLTENNLISGFKEIKQVNAILLMSNISLIFISIEKNRKNHIRELNKQIFGSNEMKDICAIIYVDPVVDVSDIASTVWRFTNNMDPKRDSFIELTEEGQYSHIGFDGTRKTKVWDGFDREWPNILVSDQPTIDKIDKIWDKLGLGKFLTSPSLKFQKQVYPGGAGVKG